MSKATHNGKKPALTDQNRVVITSIGIICPSGDNLLALKETLAKGTRTVINSETVHLDGTPVPIFPIPEFNFTQYCPRNKNRRYLSRAGELSAAAASNCLKMANLTDEQKEITSIFMGCGPYLDQEEPVLEKRRPLWLLNRLANTTASFISLTNGLHGESLSIGTACAASLQAIGHAYRAVKSGESAFALAGGGDSRLSPQALNGYLRAGALYHRNDNGLGYQPIKSSACGFIPGEGAAFFLIETLQSAKRRNATILAEIHSFAASADGYNMTAPRPDGKFQKKAILSAIQKANITVDQIASISLHGTGTPLNDAMEKQVLKELFDMNESDWEDRTNLFQDTKEPTLHAYKYFNGHLAAGCGASELAMEIAQFDTTQNIDSKKDFSEQKFSLLQNFGFGGQNAAIIISRGDHSDEK